MNLGSVGCRFLPLCHCYPEWPYGQAWFRISAGLLIEHLQNNRYYEMPVVLARFSKSSRDLGRIARLGQSCY